jgi:glycosyltransferase involved in cell wall biosynthesis
VQAAIRGFGPDVVQAHNLHARFGWRALAAARAAGARTILHLHNFRLFCAIGVAYRDGAPCFRCQGRNTLPGLRFRCRGSTAQAAVYAAGLHLQQPHLLEHSDRFAVVSEATARRLIGLGLPGERTTVLPNFVSELAPESRADAGEHALVAGRLVEEKGFDTAIVAARAAGVPLIVAGEGPDEARLRSIALGADVRFTGRLEPAQLAELRSRAAVVLAPSRWEEPCPYVVLEAMADGIPVLASDRGGLPELVGPLAALPAQDAGAWAGALAALWGDPGLRRDRGHEALGRARERFHADVYYESLMRLYG